MIPFTEVLARAIKDSNYTLREVAEHCDVSIYALKAWLIGTYAPQKLYLRRLANILYPSASVQGYNIMLNTISMEQVGAK